MTFEIDELGRLVGTITTTTTLQSFISSLSDVEKRALIRRILWEVNWE